MRRRLRILLPLFVLSLSAVGATTQAAPRVGLSGWEWSHPTPQGETLLDLAIVDSTRGYASGALGTLLSTADAGATWSSIPTGVATDLTRVTAIGASSFVTAGGCLARRSDDGGATLRRVRFTPREDPCASPVTGVSFATAGDGFLLLGDGTVLATADGGVTFTRRGNVDPGPVQPATDILMTSPTVGFATAANGVIARTTDGGGSWTRVGHFPNAVFDVAAADATTLYAAGDNGLFKSTDSGVTWTILQGFNRPRRVQCATATLCLVVDSGGLVFKTSDGGVTRTAANPFPGGVHSVGFFSATRAVAVGGQGRTAISDDAGATWRMVGTPIERGVYGVQPGRLLSTIRTNPDGLAYAFGASDLGMITTDRGATWRTFGVPTSVGIRSTSFATSAAGFVLDNEGTLFSTTNGAASWQILDVGGDFTPLEVHALSQRNVLLVGANRTLRRSNDGGERFTPAGTPAVRRLADRGARAGNAVALHSPRGIAVTANGAAWRIVRPPVVAGRARALRISQCTSAIVCWAVTTDGRLFRTTNGGVSWVDRSAAVGPYRISGLAFADRSRGYITVRDGYPTSAGRAVVLYTRDGGATWTPEQVGLRAPAPRIAPSSGIDYAIDAVGNLLTTTTGGLAGTPSVLSLTPATRTIARTTRVTLRGRLAPAIGGEQVVVSGAGQRPQTVTVASNGRFSATFTVSRTTSFVAQWGGDRTRSGDGSPAVTVRRR